MKSKVWTPRRSAPAWLTVCFVGVSFLPGQVSAAQTCLEVRISESHQRLSLAAAGKTFQTDRSAAAVSQDFRTIYQVLEKNKKLGGGEEALIRTLSREILGPIEKQVSEAQCIVFHIQPKQIHFALDLLWLGSEPLFVTKPVGFIFKNGPDFRRNPIQADARGLILRDASTDPQNGSKDARNFFPSSKYLQMKETNPGVISGVYDFVLISGHVSVTVPWEATDDDDDDSIEFNTKELTAEKMLKARYRLLYLDSCQLGISRSFIDAARQSGAQYFLAPITSNEAGNSSTKTIQYFFGSLRSGRTPMDALFDARRKIYQEFRAKPRHILLYYSFPFRIYGL